MAETIHIPLPLSLTHLDSGWLTFEVKSQKTLQDVGPNPETPPPDMTDLSQVVASRALRQPYSDPFPTGSVLFRYPEPRSHEIKNPANMPRPVEKSLDPSVIRDQVMEMCNHLV